MAAPLGPTQTPISDEAAALERAAAYLKHAKAGARRRTIPTLEPGRRAVSYDDAICALGERARTLRELAAKAAAA